MKNNENTTTIAVKSTKHRKSLKGKWGRVGAPPKATKFPRGAFTMETLFNRNKNQCELSLRNKVDAALAAKELIQLKARKQAGGAVGRPKAVFVLKDNFNAKKHERLEAVSKTRRQVEVTPTVAPTVAPVTETVVAQAVETVAEMVSVPLEPIVTQPAAEVVVAQVEQVAETAVS